MNSLLSRPHFLQSEAWEAFQQARGRRTIRQEGEGWSFMAVVEGQKPLQRLYVPYGPWARDKRSFESALEALQMCARAEGAYALRFEPLVADGFVPDLPRAHKDLQPRDTAVVDLTQPEEDIIGAMSQTTRNLWRRSEKNGLSFRTSYDPNDITLFITMIHEVAARTGMRPYPDDYFQTIASVLFPRQAAGMFIAEHEDTPVATIIFYTDGHVCSYAHAASVAAYRKLSPATPLATYSMLAAKKLGCDLYDFYGIAPEGVENHRWSGFTHFKLAQGATRVQLPGTFEIPIDQKRALAVKAARTVRKFIK